MANVKVAIKKARQFLPVRELQAIRFMRMVLYAWECSVLEDIAIGW